MSKKVITFYDSEKQEHDFPIITPDYGVCNTIASDANKIVTCDEFTLFTGATVTVNFKNAPTTNTISLNVNDSGLIAVDFNSNDCVAKDEIKANGCYDFIYNGTKWIYKGSSANKVDKVSGKSLIDKSFADNVSTSGNTTTIDQQLKTYSITTRLEADVAITGLDENGQEVTKHKLSEKANSSDVLEKTNTTEFTPTADYQPATKKYVDDSVSSLGSGDMLKSVYDKDNDGIIDDVALLQYYGTTDITISDSSYFTVNKTGETITGLTDTGKTQTELVIPYKINGVKITKLSSGIDDNSMEPQSILDGNKVITKVVVPNSVTTLGRGVFYLRKSLTSINIPNSVTSIEDSAFEDCTSLTSINIPNSVTSIGSSAFRRCTSLVSINIPDSVTSIGNYTFDSCTNLKIYCEQGSYAETFAKGKNIPIVYTDMKATALDNKVDKVEGKSLIDENVANNLSSDTTTVRIKKGTELKTNGSEINGVRIDDNSVTVEDVKNDMSDPYIGYKNVMDKDGLHIYGVDPAGNQDTNERVDITSSGVKYSGAQWNGRTLKLGFEGTGFPQLTMYGNPVENKWVKIDFDDVIVQNESTTHKLSDKFDKVAGKSLIDSNVANNISYASSSGLKLGNRWSFNVAEMIHTSPAGGAQDLKFAIDSGLTLTTAADSGDFDITLVKGSKTHKLSEKLSTTRIADGENAGSLKIGRTPDLSAEGPYSIAIGFGGHTGPDAMGAVAINGGEALGAGSVAISSCTAKGDGQIAFGKLNITDTDNKYACIIGNGHVDRGNKVYSNAYTIDWNGNGWFAGDVEGAKDGVTHKLSEKANTSDVLVKDSSGDFLYGGTTISHTEVATMGHALTEKANTSDVLTKTNTTEFTPTADYQPATKKYVDNITSSFVSGKVTTITVPTTGWTTSTDTNGTTYYSINITDSILTSTGYPITDVVLPNDIAAARLQSEAYQNINKITVNDGSVKLYCFDSLPTVSFQIRIQILYI